MFPFCRTLFCVPDAPLPSFAHTESSEAGGALRWSRSASGVCCDGLVRLSRYEELITSPSVTLKPRDTPGAVCNPETWVTVVCTAAWCVVGFTNRHPGFGFDVK